MLLDCMRILITFKAEVLSDGAHVADTTEVSHL